MFADLGIVGINKWFSVKNRRNPCAFLGMFTLKVGSAFLTGLEDQGFWGSVQKRRMLAKVLCVIPEASM